MSPPAISRMNFDPANGESIAPSGTNAIPVAWRWNRAATRLRAYSNVAGAKRCAFRRVPSPFADRTALVVPHTPSIPSPVIDANAVELVGLSKRFGQTVALDDVNLAVPAGQVFGFLGPN